MKSKFDQQDDRFNNDALLEIAATFFVAVVILGLMVKILFF